MKKNKINQEENIILDEETKIEDKKKPTAKKIVFAILLILLAVVFVVLGFCVAGGVFDVQTQCNVAYAYDATLPDDCKVGANLLKHSDLSLWDFDLSGSNRVDLFNDSSVYVGVGGSNSYSLVSNSLSSTIKSTAGSYANLRFKLYSDSNVGSFTFSSFASSVKGNFVMQCWGYDSSGIPHDVGSAHRNLSLGLNSFTYDLAGDYAFYLFLIQTYDEVTIDWVKVEVGDAFTGYIRSEDDFRSEYDALSNWRFYYTRDKVVGIVSPMGTGMYDVDGIKHYISKDTNFKVFLVPRTTKISDILNDDFTLKLKVKGLNTNDDVVRGVCYNLFDLTGYREYYYICAMASQTPKTRPSEGSTNGCLMYSYDTKTKTLYEIKPETFPDVSTEERYLDIVNFYEDFGRNSEQSDFNLSTNGIISVIQSPVNFLKDIFNFEIFGINVSAVVFFVLSITIVAFVIKKVV